LHRPPGDQGARRSGTDARHQAECRPRRPACPAACRESAWKWKVRCSTPRNRGGTAPLALMNQRSVGKLNRKFRHRCLHCSGYCRETVMRPSLSLSPSRVGRSAPGAPTNPVVSRYRLRQACRLALTDPVAVLRCPVEQPPGRPAPAEFSEQALRWAYCLAGPYGHPEKSREGRMTFSRSYRAIPMPADNGTA
jgi:hypothetical protein